MEIKKGAHVHTFRGEKVGSLDRIVIDPLTNKVTGIVVQKGGILGTDKVIPVDQIASTEPDKITLNPDIQDLNRLPDFESAYFVSEAGPTETTTDTLTPVYWYPPVGAGVTGVPVFVPPPGKMEVDQNIPDGTVPLKEGSKVYNADGQQVGHATRIFYSPDDNRLTHILISQGLINKEEKLIPASWIMHIKEDQVDLAVGSQILANIPAYHESND
jgi:uncharacterized protein YrrD